MTTIKQAQDAVKKAPHYRVTVGALEIFGAPGKDRWHFDYIVKKEGPFGARGAYGKRNAEEYLRKAGDLEIVPVTFSK